MKGICFILILLPLFIKPNNNIDSLERCLDTATAVHRIDILNQLSFSNKNKSPQKTLTFAKEAYKLAEKSNYIEGLSGASYYLGVGYSILKKYDSALIFTQKALETGQQTNNKQMIAKSLQSLGFINFKKGNRTVALKNYNEALPVFISFDDKYSTAKTLKGIARVYSSIAEYEESLKYNLDALRLFEELNDTFNIAATCVNLGGVNVYLKQFDNAIKYHNKAYRLFEKLQNTKMSSRCLANIGNVYISQKETGKALEYYQKALETNNDITDKQFRAYLLNNIGLVYENEKKFNEALYNYRKALEIKKEINDLYASAEQYNNIGNIYIEFKDFDTAYYYIAKAKTIANNLKAKEILKRCFRGLSKIYAAQGKYEKFLEYFDKYANLKDSIFIEENAKQIAEMQTKYETEKKEKENILLKKDIEIQEFRNQKLMIGLLLSALIIILMIAFVFQIKKVHLQKRKLTEERNKNLKEKLNLQNRELTTKALWLARQNEINVSILNDLKTLSDTVKSERDRNILIEIFNKIKRANRDDLWNEFETRFENVHSGFYHNIEKVCPELSANDRKLCALLRLNMSSKDISAITFKSVRAVEVARYRLRKKLGLSSDENLINYLNRF